MLMVRSEVQQPVKSHAASKLGYWNWNYTMTNFTEV
jgi:hypothetical protein